MRTTRFAGVSALALATLALALAPVLATPHVSDDVINYSFGWLSGSDFSRAVLDEMRFWILSAGRVFVLSTYLKNEVFKVFEGLVAYKVYLVATNIACAAMFLAYARMLGGSRTVAVTAILSLTFLVQLRDYHDPVVSFNGLFQLSAALVFASLALHLRFVRSSDARWLYAALAAFVVNLFLYEIAAISVVLVWIQDLVLRRGAPRRFRATFAFAVALAIYVALVVACRFVGAAFFGMGQSLYEVSLTPLSVVLTFAKQLIAVVPFTYFLFRPGDGNWGVHASPDATPWLGSWHFPLALPVFAALAWVCLRTALAEDRRENAGKRIALAPAALVAGGLVLLPAAVIALVGRYQGAFAPGNGYSVVYLQEFGAALGIALLVFALATRGGRGAAWVAPAFALATGVAAAGNLVNNYAVAAKLSEAWGPQYAWRAMLRSPDFRGLCGGVALVAEPRPWTEYRVVEHAGFRLANPADLTPGAEVCVVRSARALDRDGAAYARVAIAPGAQAQPRSAIHVVLPLEEHEARTELPQPGGCAPDAGRMALASEWRFASQRYGLFAATRGKSDISAQPPGFALPCELR